MKRDRVVYKELNEIVASSETHSYLQAVYGVVVFYLAHQPEIWTYLEKVKAGLKAKRKASREPDPMFYQKFADARRRLGKIYE